MSTNPSYIPARDNDPGTAKAAARNVDITARETECLTIFHGVKHGTFGHRHTDLTNEELADKTGDDQYSNISSRVSSLFRKGCIRLTGNERKSRQGRSQQCHEFVEPEEREKQMEINLAILAERKTRKRFTCPQCGEVHVCKKPSSTTRTAPTDTMPDVEML